MPLTGGPGRVREAPMQMDLCGGMLPPETEKNIRADLVLCSLYLSDLSSACDLGSLNLTDLRVLLVAVSLDWRKMPM